MQMELLHAVTISKFGRTHRCTRYMLQEVGSKQSIIEKERKSKVEEEKIKVNKKN